MLEMISCVPIALVRSTTGAAFPHTAVRELYMSALLAELPDTTSCNAAVGYYMYTGPEEVPLGPEIPTACIVERTLGDRRFGTHVLAGLEVCPSFVDVMPSCHCPCLSESHECIAPPLLLSTSVCSICLRLGIDCCCCSTVTSVAWVM